MSTCYVIDIRDLSKSFRKRGVGYSSLKSAVVGWFQARSRGRGGERVVLRDLTMRVPKGNSVGVIGRNGSGKSTLLKLITGIYTADAGSIAVQGRIAALIELGAGFHPDFTGRENLHLGGLLHGLTRREVDERFDKIVEFAELEGSIDEPVRTYSSGMFMRLGFSLAVHTDPDILLIDEVLAVGDVAFEAKCKDKIAELRAKGCTLLIVSHDLGAVERWCDEVLWLEGGEVRDRGEPRRVIDEYRTFVQSREEAVFACYEEAEKSESDPAVADSSERWGSREVEITGVTILNEGGTVAHVFRPDEKVSVIIDYVVHQAHKEVVFGVAVSRGDGLLVLGTNTQIERVEVPPLGVRGSLRIQVGGWELIDGGYTLDVAVHALDGYPYDYLKRCLRFAVRTDAARAGVFLPEFTWSFSSAAA